MKATVWWIFGDLPTGSNLFLHPMAFAAWWGLLATALNLMPFGQLDGGHILYSLLGRRASYVSLATLGAVVLLTLQSTSWVSVTVMMLVMAFVLGLRHPRVIDERAPLDSRRRLIALASLVIFLICFTPVPIEMFISR
jgi:membrane-associated protease RseP (regulator of RpoE activity)